MRSSTARIVSFDEADAGGAGFVTVVEPRHTGACGIPYCVSCEK